MRRSLAAPTLTQALTGLGLVVLLGLAGCSAAPSENAADVSESTSGCAGVNVIVEFGMLDEPTSETCLETTETLTALDAFAEAGFEIAPSEAYGDAIVCRVNGRPAADEELKTAENGPYLETCAEFGPVWASWAIWMNTGNGWELGQEAINTQKVQPGEQVALVWEQGDYSEMSEWVKPTV